MEDISRSDVQFDDERWVQGRKTKRTIWQLVPVEMSLRTAVEIQEDAVERMWTLSTNSECVKCTTCVVDIYMFSTSGQIVVSMICKKQRSQKQDKQPKTEQARKQMLKLGQQDGGHGGWNPLRNVL